MTFLKELAEKIYSNLKFELIFLTSVVCFDGMAPRRWSSSPEEKLVNKTNVKKSSKLKGDYLFSASSFRNVILQNVIARWSKKIFYFMKIDIEDIKSYPNV